MMKKFSVSVLLLVAAAWAQAAVLTFDNYVKEGRPLLIPEVHSYQAREGTLKLPDKFTVSFPKGEEIVLEQLAEELKRFPGIAAGEGGADAFCRFVLADRDVPEDPQGYKLVIDGKGITVTSRGTDGLFYGAQTLRNIIRNAAAPEFAFCTITDWPDFEERAYNVQMHNMPEDRFPQLKRAIDVLAGLKINRLFMNFSDSFPFSEDLLPLRKRGFKAADIRDLYDFCKRRHIQVIPTLQVFSHAAWMTSHPDWSKMREDRANPRSYRHSSQPCPLNMQARELTEKVMTELIKFFDAKSLYVCLDEIRLCPFHECEDCVKHDPKELLKDYFAFVFGVLDKYGVKGYVCQDSFLVNPDTWPLGDYCRSLLPKGTVVRFWSYVDNLNEYNVALFKDFVLYGNAICGKPLNVYNMAHLVKKYGGVGCGMTHWYYSKGGVFSVLETESPDSLGGIVIGADYFWNLRKTSYRELTYDGTFEMMRRLYPEKLTLAPRPLAAFPVPLEKVVNAELSASGKFPRFASDAEVEELAKVLAALPEKFRLVTSAGGKYYALRLTGKGPGRANAVFSLGGRKAEYLSLLLTTSRPENGRDYHGMSYGFKRFAHDTVANVTLVYADGEKVKVPLRYRQELTDWNRPFGGLNMRFAVRGVDADKNYYSFGICDVKNPHPEKPLKSFGLTTARADNLSPALLALSLRGADRPFGKFPKLDLADFAKRRGVDPDPEVRRNIRFDFSNGFENAVVGVSPSAAKALKYGIVDDPSSPAKGKILKITLPAGNYVGRKSDNGLIRVELNMPYRFAADEQSFAFDVKVTADPEQRMFGNVYVIDRDLKAAGKRKFRLLSMGPFARGVWQHLILPFKLYGNHEQRLMDKSKVRFCRISFFIGANVAAPVEICLAAIGGSPENVTDVELWKEGGEAEPFISTRTPKKQAAPKP